MRVDEYSITQEGRLYCWLGHRRTLIGHISCALREQSRLGQDVRVWWQARLAAEEPGENIVFTKPGEFYFVRSDETTADEEGDQETGSGTGRRRLILNCKATSRLSALLRSRSSRRFGRSGP